MLYVSAEQAAGLVTWRGEDSPIFRTGAREAGYLLRMLQEGERLSMRESRPMPTIGANCHELRVTDGNVNWRILYGISRDAVVVLEVFEKKARATPKHAIDVARRRWNRYRRDSKE